MVLTAKIPPTMTSRPTTPTTTPIMIKLWRAEKGEKQTILINNLKIGGKLYNVDGEGHSFHLILLNDLCFNEFTRVNLERVGF